MMTDMSAHLSFVILREDKSENSLEIMLIVFI
jgi:hypothetical protein